MLASGAFIYLGYIRGRAERRIRECINIYVGEREGEREKENEIACAHVRGGIMRSDCLGSREIDSRQ